MNIIRLSLSALRGLKTQNGRFPCKIALQDDTVAARLPLSATHMPQMQRYSTGYTWFFGSDFSNLLTAAYCCIISLVCNTPRCNQSVTSH